MCCHTCVESNCRWKQSTNLLAKSRRVSCRSLATLSCKNCVTCSEKSSAAIVAWCSQNSTQFVPLLRPVNALIENASPLTAINVWACESTQTLQRYDNDVDRQKHYRYTTGTLIVWYSNTIHHNKIGLCWRQSGWPTCHWSCRVRPPCRLMWRGLKWSNADRVVNGYLDFRVLNFRSSIQT